MLCCSLNSVHADWREEILASATPLVPAVGVPSRPCSGSPPTERKICTRWSQSEPCLHPVCVQAIGPPGGTELLYFISGALAGFQKSKLYELNIRGTPPILWERVFLCCGWSWLSQKGSCMNIRGLEFMVKNIKKAASS